MARKDPYWDAYINRPPADLSNAVVEIIRGAPEGNVFPTQAELHTPEITSRHVKELARYLGADLVGITASTPGEDPLPFAVVCAVRAEHDPRTSPGIGGQVPVQNALFVTFVLSAWIRELGYRATSAQDPRAGRFAAKAGLEVGSRMHVGNVILTDLPLAPDRQG